MKEGCRVDKMYCPKCGKENPEDARFCMDCGADLGGYRVVISPKISVSAKAEGGVALKWKQKPTKYTEIREKGKIPVFEKFIGQRTSRDGSPRNSPEVYFCPQCGNYGSITLERGDEFIVHDTFKEDNIMKVDIKKVDLRSVHEVLKLGDEWVWMGYNLFKCQACGTMSLLRSYDDFYICILKYVYLDLKGIGKIPIYGWVRADDHGNGKFHNSFIPACPTCPMCGAEVSHSCSFVSGIKSYDLWKCAICNFQFLTADRHYEEKTKSHAGSVHPLCNVCGTRKADHHCYLCHKSICEKCAITRVIKKGLFSKETVKVCPNCIKKK
ncbi:zinc-ribbon domain-containing protein [Candidatus Methanophagaceae archaeon]|nr:zinc-ribbon domain-containing protein [Methanophagales archaeon]